MWFMTALILSDAQAVALEKRWLAVKIETVHPGYLGSQDRFYLGNFKGGWSRLSIPTTNTFTKCYIT